LAKSDSSRSTQQIFELIFLLFVLLLWAASIVEPMAFLVACHLTNKYACLLACTSKCTKVKHLDTCYSAAYRSHSHDQQRFTISKVAADGAAAHYVAIHCPRK